jgi:gliding motility-associated-like protein
MFTNSCSIVQKIKKNYGLLYTCIVVLFNLFISSSLFAQSTPGPCFTSNITRGCAPLSITLTNCSSDGSEISYDYGSGIDASNTHTFTQPGKYTIKQVGNFTSSQGGDTLTLVNYIEVLDTPAPAFLVSSCRGNTVNVKINEAVYDRYVINFGDGTTQTVAPNSTTIHTYPGIAPQTITVIGQYSIRPNPPGGVCQGTSSSQIITPIQELVKPAINVLEVKSDTEISLSFNVESYLNYKIYQKTGVSSPFQEIASLSMPTAGTSIQNINNINSSQNIYTYKVEAIDVCGNTLSSDEMSSIQLTGSAINNQNNLSWQQNTTTSFGQYTIIRNTQILTQLTSATQRQYQDLAVQCPNEYCYRISGQTLGGATSISNIICIKAISDTQPPTVQNFLATIHDQAPLLTWHLATGITAAEFIIFRSDNGGDFRELDRTPNLSYHDTQSNINTKINTYCYQITYIDACGNKAASGPLACPILLNLKLTENLLELNWTAYRDWIDGVNTYVVEKLDNQGTVYESKSAGMSLAYANNLTENPDDREQLLRFRIRAELNGNNMPIIYSNIVEVIQPQQLYFPDAFTPDGNGLNDTFEPKGIFITSFEMMIYNRWGEVLYTTDNIEQGWNGTFRNEAAPAGTYIYHIKTKDFLDRNYKKQGSFTLIR